MYRRSLGWLAVVVVIGGCSKSSTEPSPPPVASGTGTQVRIQGDAYNYGDGVFSPQTLTTNVGSKVVWTNADSVTHSTISDTGLWRADTITARGTFEFTFTSAGTYAYKCQIHSGMTGTIVVR